MVYTSRIRDVALIEQWWFGWGMIYHQAGRSTQLNG